MSVPLTFHLPGFGSIRSVPLLTPDLVASMWVSRAPLFLGQEAIPALDAWAAQVAHARPDDEDGPGRSPAEQQSLAAYLRSCALTGAPITPNALWREGHGGREYPFVIPGYTGPITISRRAYRAAAGPGGRLMLSAIRKDVRRLLRPPLGVTLLEADFTSCHGHIALALTGDEALARDLAQDFHQVTGDWMLDQGAFPNRSLRRSLGKRVNNAMFFGRSHHGLPYDFDGVLGAKPDPVMALNLWAAWWDRYPALKAFREEVQHAVYTAQYWERQIWVVSPSDRTSKFTIDEVFGRPTPWNPRQREPDEVWRSVFSAVFRAVESDLLQRTLGYFVAGQAVHGGRLAMPLYDGLLATAPVGNVQNVAAALEEAGAQAGRDLGLHSIRLKVDRPEAADLVGGAR